MIDLRDDILQQVRAILKEHVPEAEVRAFGSRVQGSVKKYSDLDLAIVGPKKLSLKVIGDLREAFAESDIPIRVDIIDWHAISDEFKEVVGQGYEVIAGAIKK